MTYTILNDPETPSLTDLILTFTRTLFGAGSYSMRKGPGGGRGLQCVAGVAGGAGGAGGVGAGGGAAAGAGCWWCQWCCW